MRRRRTAEAWRELIDGFAGSGLTVPAYCARSRISAASFHRWRARFGGVKRASTARSTSAAPVTMPITPAPFVELGAIAAARSGLELRLDLGGGLTLQLSRS